MNSNLNNADLTQSQIKHIRNTNLSAANLEHTDFSHGILEEVNFEGVQFNLTNFIGTDLTKTDLTNIDLSGIIYDFQTKFSQRHSLINAYLICAGANLSQLQLYRKNLQGANLVNSKLIKTNFFESNLRATNFKGATLKKANLKAVQIQNSNLSYANCSEANFERACLSGANLTGAILSDTNLRFADLRGANLENAKLNNACLKDIIYNEETKIDPNIDLSEAYLSLKSIHRPPQLPRESTEKSLLLQLLDRINFSGEFNAGLTRGEIDELTQELPFTFPEELYELYQWHNGMKGDRGWDNCFIGTYEFISLEEALEYTKILPENLEENWQPDLFFAFAEGTDNSYILLLKLAGKFAKVIDMCPDSGSLSSYANSITDMMLREAISQTVTGKANLREINLANLDLNGWNFYRANLSGVNLSGTNLKGANLSYTNLTGATLTNTDFTDAIFKETIMLDGSIKNK